MGKWFEVKKREMQNIQPQRPQREIMLKNSVNSLVFADQEAFPLN